MPVIKGIAKIKGLGVYENYTKPAGTQEFGVKNLIYGWNYSGKTTLSRLFALLETKKPNQDLAGCEFSFESCGQPITDKNFAQSGLTVRVFNSDFVRENLHFEVSSFKPILLLGKDSEEAKNKIIHLNERITRSELTRKNLNRQCDTITQTVADEKTKVAKYIRQLLKVDPYTATHLSNDMLVVGILDSQLLSEKDITDSLELSLTPDNKKPSTVDRVSALPLIEALYKEAVAVLAATPNFSSTLMHLEEHLEIERWVETGLHIHKEEGSCEFCGNTVTEDRLALFRAHFSKDLADHKQNVEGLLGRVKAAEVKLTLPKETEFNPQFRENYEAAAASLPKALDAFNHAVETLAKDVQRKVDAPRKPMEPTPLTEGLAQAVADAVKVINAAVDDNNMLAVNFATAKVAAIRKVKQHYVQQLIDTLVEAGYERKKARLIKRHYQLKTFDTSLQSEVEKLQAMISQAQLGRERINERLTSMLGSEGLQITVIQDPATHQEQFSLVRKSGKVAKHLSDGERTAIAFAYFLTKLQELKPEEFEQTIVYIDDPISSLDANHLFQVNAAIKEIFFGKNHEGKWTTRCKQFFLSTHNFQFFDLVRELEPQKPPRAQLYFLRKVSSTESIFGNMPKSLCKYSSEYHFLFETILNFRASHDKPAYEGLMLLPNAVRRFAELYTYSRMPVDIDGLSVDRRAETLFGAEPAKRILKVLHYFSHGNNIEKFAGNNELIFDLEHAVNDLFSVIESKDPHHWKALMDAVQA